MNLVPNSQIRPDDENNNSLDIMFFCPVPSDSLAERAEKTSIVTRSRNDYIDIRRQ